MKLANLNGRAALINDTTAVDVEKISDGRFPSEVIGCLEQWQDFSAWARTVDVKEGDAYDPADLRAPVERPAQIFAIGLNYRDHAEESNLPLPEHLIVFTKFASSLAAPNADVKIVSEQCDYETELVIVIGKEGHQIAEADAYDHVAGFSIGQDYSERELQLRKPAPQFSLGKSYPGFGPYGPAITSVDELENPDSLKISATITGEGIEGTKTLQDGTTSDLVFPVSRIISDLSQVVTLYPGDIIFTGTPAGVGGPQGFFLKPGQTLTSTLEGVGSITNTFN